MKRALEMSMTHVFLIHVFIHHTEYYVGKQATSELNLLA